MKTLKYIIRLYYMSNVLRNLSFFIPVWVIFLYSQGYNIFTIFLLDAIFWTAIIFSVLPTGILADKFSRKKVFITGIFLISIAITIFALNDSLWLIVFSYTLWGLGISFCSGAEQAYLYDTLIVYRKEEDFQEIYGHGLFLGGIATTFSCFVGGFIAIINLRYPLLLTALMTFLGGILLLVLPENFSYEKEGLTSKDHISSAISLITSNPVILILFFFSSLFNVVVVIESTFRQIYLTELGVNILFIGIIYSISILFISLGFKSSSYLTNRFGANYYLCIQAGFISISLFMLIFASPWISIPGIIIYRYFISTFEPFFFKIIHDHIPSNRRATIFSLHNLFIAFCSIICEIIVGFFAYSIPIVVIYSIITFFFVITSSIMLYGWISRVDIRINIIITSEVSISSV